MRKEKKYHYIYKTICLITDRFYIGMHSTDDLNDGYMGSGKRLWYSFKKYGKDNHKVEILEYLDTRKLLKEREKELVNQDMLNEYLCMNLAIGGTGGILNEEHRKVFLESSNIARKLHLERLKHNKKYLDNHNEKWVTIVKQSHQEGKIKYNNFKGKKHTEETKLKISETLKIKQKGDKNSQYGSMWITNGLVNKKISKVTDIPIGWRKGRVINK